MKHTWENLPTVNVCTVITDFYQRLLETSKLASNKYSILQPVAGYLSKHISHLNVNIASVLERGKQLIICV